MMFKVEEIKFTCANGIDVPEAYKCDGEHDCADTKLLTTNQ